MQDFIAHDWQSILAHNRLDSFEAWWNLDAPWFEEPNQRRGGWSGVSRVELELPTGGRRGVFLKRQQEHITRTWRHPFKGVLTFERELQNILACQAAGIPALEAVFFARQCRDGKRCAVLVTAALDGYSPLEPVADRAQRRQLLYAVADTVQRLHAAGLQHNCLYPKHVFVRLLDGKAEARLIDLEKAKHVRRRQQAMLRDLDSLNRHADGWSRTDRLRFLKAYLATNGTGDDNRTQLRDAWHALASRYVHKQRKRQ